MYIMAMLLVHRILLYRVVPDMFYLSPVRLRSLKTRSTQRTAKPIKNLVVKGLPLKTALQLLPFLAAFAA
jgi:hypothetical protein